MIRQAESKLSMQGKNMEHQNNLQAHIKECVDMQFTQNLYSHKYNFDFNDVPMIWNNNSPVNTFFENSLSVMIPIIEKFLVDTVREAVPHIKFNNKLLEEDVVAFCDQEDYHSEMHEQFNICIKNHGFDVEGMRIKFRNLDNKYRELPLSSRLMICTIGETLTSVFGKYYMDAMPNKDIPSMVKKMYILHAIEELEHRCVAYNVHKFYQNSVGDKFWISKWLAIKWLSSYIICCLNGMFIHLWKTKNLFKFKTINDFAIMMFSKESIPYRASKGLMRLFRKNYDPEIAFGTPDISSLLFEWESNYHKK
jgi:uncharacterized protein